jgi:hypothetical protein
MAGGGLLPTGTAVRGTLTFDEWLAGYAAREARSG